MTRTFWLSFCGPKVDPDVDSFRGVCIIDVTDEDAEHARQKLARLFPNALPGAEWIAAATQLAHLFECNPGGEVMSSDITDVPQLTATFPPRNRLLSRADLEALATSPTGDKKVNAK
jgi:hypothetical protein